MTEAMQTLNEERESIARAGRLHWAHWSIVLASLLLTIGAWQFSRSQVEKNRASRFNREAERVIELVEERMELYENALWSGVAAIEASGGDVSNDDWRAFSESLRIGERYPGIKGIGLIDHFRADELPDYLESQRQTRPGFDVYPRHDHEWHWPIRIVEPVATNAKAIGLDIAHEWNRRSGAEEARDTGTAQITGPIVLVQDDAKTAGFLFFAPYYANDAKPDGAKPDGSRTTVAKRFGSSEDQAAVLQRRESIKGLVYAPFVVDELLAGTLRRETRHVGIRITDGDELMYDEHNESEPDWDPNPLYTITQPHSFYGRNWVFDIRSARSFRADTFTNQSALILVGGVAIDGLLLSLFIALSRAKRRTLAFADRATRALTARTRDLERSNEELARFAYITSHDLKTPLRGIGDLTEFLREDLEEYLKTEDANPDVEKNLARLDQQVDRMEALIRGVLAYSSIDSQKFALDSFDLVATTATTMSDLGFDETSWQVEGEPTVFETDAVRLGQVISNLVANAAKHHDQPETLRVRVAIAEAGEEYSIRIEDNGPGIEARFHERIFEIFQTLKPQGATGSTGIGLAIVKKLVERVGGTIRVESQPGQGATFVFTWPKHYADHVQADHFEAEHIEADHVETNEAS